MNIIEYEEHAEIVKVKVDVNTIDYDILARSVVEALSVNIIVSEVYV